MRLVILSILVAALGCKGDGADKSEPDKTAGDKTAGDKTAGDNAGDKTAGDKTAGDKTAGGDKPAPELLDEPTERRLHIDRAEASSFLWNDWNRFQENYHPLYVADDDPKTAWVEGADGSGAGQWLRLHVTEAAATTAVKLALKNGYHKSKSLFSKNARAKAIDVKLLPSGVTKRFELADSMDVATLSLEQPSGPLSAVELSVAEVYEGTKYADLCLSDIEIHVTSKTPENPAFEKAKLDRVRSWKKERLAAAELFASAEGKAMPVGTSYRVVGAKRIGEADQADNPVVAATDLTGAALEHIGSHKKVLERARAGLSSSFSGWKAASAAVKKGRKVPAIDGLHVPEVWELLGSYARDDSYTLPLPGLVEFLTSSRISLFESSENVSVADALAGKPRACRRDHGATKHYYYRPPEGGAGGVTNELLVIQCGMIEERDGFYPYVAFQLIEYDDSGKIAAIVEPGSVTAFTWTDGGDRLGAGKRVRRMSKRLMGDSLIARK